ncbi:MAG TPA: DMT family transporter [Burkholderiales bacterium]|nr:DMT family transporter [Burkholderiales bacterium]
MNHQTRGALLMAGGALLITLNDVATKLLTANYPVGQVMCLRHASTLLVIVPYAFAFTGLRALRVTHWPGQLVRGTLFIASAVFMIWSLSVLPLTTVTAIVFASPIFVAVLATPLLKERVSPRRWLAVIVGFCGVLVVVRPGSTAFDWVLLLPVLAAAVNAFRDIITRHLSRTETSISILFWSTVIVMMAGLATAPFGWNAVTPGAAALFVAAGVSNAGAHFLMIEALRYGEAAAVAPVRYTILLWAIVFGFVLWAEVPGLAVLLGAALIIGSTLYGARVK